MKLNDFLKPEFLGNKFIAVKGYTGVVSIQDETSDFFMEMITVKVKTLNPTISVSQMESNKTCPVILKDLNVGQYNGNLWFSCTDVLPVSK